MATIIDLTAKADVDITHKVKTRGVVTVTIKENGVAIPITGATISYKAGTILTKDNGVSGDIDITDGPNGEFEITFKEADANTITTKTVLKHECTITIASNTYPLFDGNLILETSLF